MTEPKAIEKIKYRIATASQLVGTGVDGKEFEDLEMAIKAFEEVQIYRAIEKRLKKIYGEYDGLLEVVVNSLEKHENFELPSITVKSRLLTDEDVDMWDAYREIGTVSECKLNKVLADKRFEYFFEGIDLLEKYKAIGTIEELQTLKEKKESK